VWGRFETSSSACTNTLSTYFHAAYVENLLPHYGKEHSSRGGGVLGLDIIIEFRTREFPNALRLARIHATPKRFVHHCHACDGDVPGSI
jgi:hypothetical protein